MKELYIRIGNTLDTKWIIIIGEEKYMGSRDKSGYSPHKGDVFSPMVKVDPYSGNINLTYIHATPNVVLDSPYYQSDHDIHKFVKTYCKDLVSWDGEKSEGYVRSREAFLIVNGSMRNGFKEHSFSPEHVAWELYRRIEWEVHRYAVDDVSPYKFSFSRIFYSICHFIQIFMGGDKKKYHHKKKNPFSEFLNDIINI